MELDAGWMAVMVGVWGMASKGGGWGLIGVGQYERKIPTRVLVAAAIRRTNPFT